jgi:mono/diheme cytochrome c family protein
MARTILNSMLLAATVALLGLNWLLAPDTNRRNFEVLPGMARSVPFDSFAANPGFADGKTLREPVPGTIVRGQMPLHYTASKADAERAGRELASPVSGNKAALARGAVIYASHCQGCHGPEGKGDGVVAQRGFPAPPSFLAEKAMKMADGQMFHVLTWGQGNMPSYASHIDREDRWKVIEHVRKLQGKRR